METRDGATRLGIELLSAEVRNREELPTVFAAIVQERPDAWSCHSITSRSRLAMEIAEFAAKNKLPTIYSGPMFVEAGGLIIYTVDFHELWRRAAVYVDRILKGAKPADLPIEQPTKFKLTINLKTAKALGLAIAPSLLAQADQIIE